MKKSSFRLIFATIVAAVALAACAKDISVEKKSAPSAVAEGSRTIVVSFAPSTKTALDKDGLTPRFQLGDTIKVALKDGTAAPEDCHVAIENDIAVIHTNLEGDIVAVYPSSAANVKENFIDGVCVSPKQTGKFADANICRADISAGSNSATFINETAILKFYIDNSIGVKSITIENKEYIADNSTNITVDGADENSILSEITKGTSNERICYVAVLAGTHTALNFTSVTSSQGAPVQKQLNEQTTLATGTMYNVFLPYYIQVGDQKWAYCNLGAFLPEEQGLYFAWGETTGHEYNDKTYKFEDGHDFNWANCPFNNGSEDYNSEYFTTLKETVCPDGVLDMKYDAANAILGGNWRIPNWSDFQKLLDNTKTTGKDISDVGYRHLQIAGTDLIFPATGHGYGETVTNPGIDGSYWTSNLSGDEYALTLIFSGKNYGPTSINSDRYAGNTIRPIYETPAPAIPNGALPGEFTVAVDTTGQGLPPTKVHFSKGNLQATYKVTDYVWGFAEHQYDYIAETSGNMSMDSPSNGDVVDLFGWVGKSSSFTGAAVYGISDNDKSEDYSNDVNDVLKSDWGNTIDDKGTWRTLSKDEWNYLLYSREMKNGGARYHDFSGGITLKDKDENDVTGYGLVLYPDGFADQDSWVNAYKTWDEFAQNGLVFLPAAGRRNGNNIEYYGQNEHCYYWTSTHESTKASWAYYLWVYSSSDPEFTDIWCDAGNAVRLVTNCATNK